MDILHRLGGAAKDDGMGERTERFGRRGAGGEENSPHPLGRLRRTLRARTAGPCNQAVCPFLSN